MPEIIYKYNNSCINKYNGGTENGTMYNIAINESMNRDTFKELLKIIFEEFTE